VNEPHQLAGSTETTPEACVLAAGRLVVAPQATVNL
jgi:hypothetical protein